MSGLRDRAQRLELDKSRQEAELDLLRRLVARHGQPSEADAAAAARVGQLETYVLQLEARQRVLEAQREQVRSSEAPLAAATAAASAASREMHLPAPVGKLSRPGCRGCWRNAGPQRGSSSSRRLSSSSSRGCRRSDGPASRRRSCRKPCGGWKRRRRGHRWTERGTGRSLTRCTTASVQQRRTAKRRCGLCTRNACCSWCCWLPMSRRSQAVSVACG